MDNTMYYSQSGDLIKGNLHVQDLGITMSDNAVFRQHIHEVATASHKMAGWILRTFKTRETKCLLLLWKALVIPKLEYCCHLWSPMRIGDFQEIEMVQRNFTRCISYVSHLDYWERLQTPVTSISCSTHWGVYTPLHASRHPR